jgi:hypothetical protein
MCNADICVTTEAEYLAAPAYIRTYELTNDSQRLPTSAKPGTLTITHENHRSPESEYLGLDDLIIKTHQGDRGWQIYKSCRQQTERLHLCGE